MFKPLISISSYNVPLSRALQSVAVALVEDAEAKIGFGHDQLLRFIFHSFMSFVMLCSFSCRNGLTEFQRVVSKLHETD